MRLKAFFAADGDCLLLTTADGRHVLVDGGRTGSFRENARPHLAELADAGEEVDLLVVSHIDADHISGVIDLLEEVAAWEVHDFQVGEGQNPTFPEPPTPRPPRIHGLWHNSWRAQLGDLEGPITALAAQASEALSLATSTVEDSDGAARLALDSVSGLAESIADGVTLLRLVDDETPIRRNEPFGSGLVLLRSPVHEQQVGSATLHVIGPGEQHLRKLREEWKAWLTRQPSSVRRGGQRPGGQEDGHENAGSTLPMSPPQARDLVEDLAQAAQAAAVGEDADAHDTSARPRIIETTRPTNVTTPNRASITLLVEEDGRTLLLTGDAAEEEILEGLTASGRLPAQDPEANPFRCNVVKVQHHGSEHNLSRVFASRVLADHYVLSADGAHGNPNPSVVHTLIETRAEADPSPFTLWFTCSEERTIPQRRKAMRAALKEARRLESRHTGQVTVTVLADDQPFLEIEV
ncbi:MBL fold metallo-hydrolase [Knoellia sp. CPCC 206450]|uniref:MBL fold metallo-hydrolase n=1 Tax=Knoellia tibetensis TaxID=3404798 RepID=UPI003B438034